mgnify:CR=1 FL=1
MAEIANLLLVLQGAVVLTQTNPEDPDDEAQIEIHRAYPGGVPVSLYTSDAADE